MRSSTPSVRTRDEPLPALVPVRLDGHDLATASESRRDALRARCIGYIFQTFNLLQGYTCMENVLLGMSWLSRVRMDERDNLLMLERKF